VKLTTAIVKLISVRQFFLPRDDEESRRK